MKTFFAASLVVFFLLVVPAIAAPATGSLLAGRWKLQVETLPMPPEARPKSAILDFREGADGTWTTHVEIFDQNDHRMYSESTLSLDGTPGRASGTYWVDVIAAKMPEPGVLVMQFVYEGIPRSTRIYSVNAEGSVLTETEAFFKEDGTPMMRTAFFDRVADKP